MPSEAALHPPVQAFEVAPRIREIAAVSAKYRSFPIRVRFCTRRPSDELPTGSTFCVGPLGVVSRRILPFLRKLTYSFPSTARAVPTGRFPPKPLPAASSVGLLRVSVAGLNVSLHTPWLLEELSGT